MIKFEIDTKGFFKEIDEEKKKLYATIMKVIRKVAFDGFSNIIRESPVDTGRFRSSWIVTTSQKNAPAPDSIVLSGEEGAALSASMKRLDKISNFRLGQILSLINNVEYGVYIEYGSPKQAAVAMVKLNTDKMQNAIDEALKAL